MTIATVGTLFPAIPLAIVALNFRYTSLAGLMRNISSQIEMPEVNQSRQNIFCLLYTSPSPRDATLSRMPSSA